MGHTPKPLLQNVKNVLLTVKLVTVKVNVLFAPPQITVIIYLLYVVV